MGEPILKRLLVLGGAVVVPHASARIACIGSLRLSRCKQYTRGLEVSASMPKDTAKEAAWTIIAMTAAVTSA